VEKTRPAGSVGETDHDTTVPPIEVGVTVVMRLSLVNESEFGVYEIPDGAISFTSMVIVAVSLPPALVAVIVYMVEDTIAVGVPEISPVEVEKVSPAGIEGDIAHVTTAPPPVFGVAVVIAVPLVSVKVFGEYAITGGASLIKIVTVSVALPPVFVAVTVYAVEEETTVGVPLISPVDVSKAKPLGREGEIDHVTTVPPAVDGVTAVIAVPLVKVNGFPLYVIEDGATSLTTTVMVVVPLPPVLVAVTVYVAEEVIAVGVPEISPFEVEKVRPAGRDGDIDHDVTAPPLAVGVFAVMTVSLVNVNGFPL